MRHFAPVVVVMFIVAAGAVFAQADLTPAELDARGITFYAPFDGSAVAAYARGNPEPIYLDSVDWVEGRSGRAVLTKKGREAELGKTLGRAGGLNYDAAGHLYGERGTVAYWFRPRYDADDPAIRSGSNSTGPYLVNVSAREDTYYNQFIRAGIKGGSFYLWVVDATGKWHGPNYTEGIRTWKAGDWHHIVMTWDATQGMRFYDNGELKYSTWGDDPFPPATPWKIAVGAPGPTSRPQWTTCADAVYDELVLMDRAVSDGEVIALMQGRLADLRPSPPVQYTDQQLSERRLAERIEEDPNRPVFAAEGGVVAATSSRVQAGDIHMRFIEAALLADGRWEPMVRFAQGGLTMPRDITITGERPADYLVVAGAPPEGEAFTLADAPLTTTAAATTRVALPAEERRIVLHVPGASEVGEIQLFRRRPGLPEWEPDLSWRLSAAARPTTLGDQAAPLLRRLDPLDRRLLAPGEAGDFAPLAVPPTRHLYLASEPVDEDLAVNRIRITLPVKPAAATDVVRVTVPHVYEPGAFYLSVDMGVEWDGARELAVLLEGPGMIFPEGSRVLVEVATSWGFELTGPPELAVGVQDTGAQAEAFALDYLRFINEEFTSRMSQNFKFYSRGIERDNPLTRCLERVLKFDPDNERALKLKRWARIEPWPEFVEEAPGPADFPAVVREARMAAVEARDVIHWWINERQDETGYMVGRADMWNDDTKLFNEYGWLWLLSGDEKLAGAVERYLRAHWASGRMVNGWSKPWTDIVHSAEEASYLEPTMALYDYGDPLHIEQLMQTASNVDYWTAINDFGHRHFKSNFFTARKMKTEGHFGHDVGLNATAMTASMYLAWYCRHPRAMREFLEWVDAWVEDTARETDDKPAGRIPSWVDFATDTLGADKGVYASQLTMMMNAAYQLTGDEKYLEPLLGYLRAGNPRWPQYLNMAAADLRRDLGPGGYDEVMRAWSDERIADLRAGEFFQRGMYYQELPCVLGWMITGDGSYLETAARHCWRCNRCGRNIYTVEDPHKDRVYPWGKSFLPWMYCGGAALNRRGSGPYPTVRVSWVDTGYDFAALVHEDARDHLCLTAYNFTGEREVGMRIWNMAPGVYEVTVTPRGGEPRTRPVELRRGEVVRFELPAESWAEVELTLSAPGDWSPTRPDLALSRTEGVSVEGGVATVIVHNIGSVDAPACVAALMRGDERISEVEVPALPAPLDLRPSTVEVRLEMPRAPAEDLRVVIDTDDEVPEVTEVNNSLSVAK
ncbi:MAG: hypothetical protein J7M38_14770 [Armatimonadetes bacterium]|nr:hypothetical protein [Armatimonadota bacterium]